MPGTNSELSNCKQKSCQKFCKSEAHSQQSLLQHFHNICSEETTTACLFLHGYWADINSQAWMNVCWDWNRSTPSSNNKLSPLPFLPQLSAVQQPHTTQGGEMGVFPPSSFLSSTSCPSAFVICHQCCHYSSREEACIFPHLPVFGGQCFSVLPLISSFI